MFSSFLKPMPSKCTDKDWKHKTEPATKLQHKRAWYSTAAIDNYLTSRMEYSRQASIVMYCCYHCDYMIKDMMAEVRCWLFQLIFQLTN